MGPARTSATMWSAASPDGAVRGSRLDLPPLTVWSTSSIPRPDLPPHRRRCLQLAVAGHHDSLLQFFQRSFQRCNRGYVVVTEPSSDTPVVMPCKTWTSLSLKQCLSPTSPELVGFFCSSPVQPGSMTAELSPATPVVRTPPQASPEHTIQAPPSVRAGGGVCCFRPQHPLCYQML
jgi:hypothetical protein